MGRDRNFDVEVALTKARSPGQSMPNITVYGKGSR